MADTIYNLSDKHAGVEIPLKLYDNQDDTNLVGVVSESSLIHHIHAGKGFKLFASGSIATGASLELLGRTNGAEVHFRSFEINTEAGNLTIDFIEGVNVTATGSSMSSTCLNRELDNTATLLTYSTPTYTGGTLIDQSKILSGDKKLVFDGGIQGEFVLKANTDYIFKITNNESQDVNFDSSFIWYEF